MIPRFRSTSPPSSDPVILKFTPGPEGEEKITLREAFARFLLPRLAGQRAAGTLEAYETALRHWEKLTPDPDVRDIDDLMLDLFRDSLLADNTAETVKKQWRAIRAILRACCPRNSGNKHGRPRAEALLDDVPCFEISGERRPRRKRVATDDELARMYLAADAAKFPRKKQHSPGDYWRAILVTLPTFGPRRDDCLLLDRREVILSPACPDPDLRLVNPWGWLSFVPRKTKRTKPDPLILPLTRVVRAHLDLILSGTIGDRVFPVGDNRGTWRECLIRIQEAAGIEKPFTFHDLRTTANIRWHDLPGSHRAGEDVLGHAPRGVNARNYEESVERLCRLAPAFALPAAMSRTDHAPRQMTLFGA